MKTNSLMCGFIFLFVFILTGCVNKQDELFEKEDDEQVFPDGEGNELKLSVDIELDGVNAISFYKDCYLSSIYDEISVSDKSMKLECEINGKVQTYYLTDGDDKIYMISRVSDTRENKEIQFNVESTALAFVTLNPFFAHVDSMAYDILSEAIRENQHFSLLCNEVRNVVNQKKDLYDPGNSALIAAFDLLLENMMDLPDKKNDSIPASRAIDDSENYYPFKLKSSGNVLEMQVFGLNPNYYGTATHGNGKVEELVVYSHDDFGIFDFISNIWDVAVKKNEWKDKQYGEVTKYTFPEDGECKFDFSCRTEKAQKELTLNILYSILDILGIPSDVASQTEIIKDMFEDVIKNLPGDINDVVNNGGTGVNLPFFPFCLGSVSDFESYCSQVYSIYLDAMQASTVKAMGKLSGNSSLSLQEKTKLTLKHTAIYKRLGAAKKSLFLQYSLPKSILNIIGRLGAYHTAKDVVLFDLCCYNDKIEVCNKLYKLAGDEQLGMPGEELEIPLTLNAHIDFPESPSDYVVRFSVEEGGGTLSEEVVNVEEYKNEMTKWTLGHGSKAQKVKASLLLKETGEEVCEPVYFTATIGGKIYIVSGNGQVGKLDGKLAHPLVVGLEGKIPQYNPFKVRFDVISGGGEITDESGVPCGGYWEFGYDFSLDSAKKGQVEAFWKLGPDGSQEQKVRAVLMYDNEECSDPIYFTAKVNVVLGSIRDILEQIYHQTNGDNWTNNENWLSDKPIEEWYGVDFVMNYDTWESTDDIELNLGDNNLTGSLDLTITGVSALEAASFFKEIQIGNNGLTNITLIGFDNLESFHLHPDSLSCLRDFKLVGKGIKEIRFLSDCPQLVNFDIRGCENLERLDFYGSTLLMDDLDLSNMRRLKEVDFFASKHNIKNINVSGCISLEEITSVPIDGVFENLVSFNASGCSSLKGGFDFGQNFSSLVVQGCVELEGLSCDGSVVKSLDLSDCKNLKDIYLDECNSLESLDISGCYNIEDIYVWGSKLKSIDLSNRKQLRRVDLNYIPIQSLNLNGCSALTDINCMTCSSLSSFEFDGCYALEEFYCRGTKITKEIPTWCRPRVVWYERRYTDYWVEELKVGDGVIRKVHYKDNGFGWWHPGEPQSGKHIPWESAL